VKGFLFSIEALMGYLIFAYLIMSVHVGVESSPFSQMLLKKYTQDLVVVSGYDGTYDWIQECEKEGRSILTCGNVLNHVESQVEQLSENLGVVVKINGFDYCSGPVMCELGDRVRASSRDVIYQSMEETISVEFIIYVK
jgi:hypothetical protein